MIIPACSAYTMRPVYSGRDGVQVLLKTLNLVISRRQGPYANMMATPRKASFIKKAHVI